MNWKHLTDAHGNPMDKFNDGTNRQITIHYDKSGSVTASHVKNPCGRREFVNPADAYLAGELLKTWE